MLDRLFVYGTLRPGGSRWEILADRCRSVLPARTEGALYRIPNRFPAARFGESGTVVGDLVTLEPDRVEETLDLTDRVEGVRHGLFERVVVEVDTELGGSRAWAYQYRGEVVGADRLPGGDWLEATGG